jgi:hypothetical protein
MSGIAKVSVLAFGGNAAIYVGFAFINAKLFPDLLAVFYKSRAVSGGLESHFRHGGGV